jgi:hypothetical protein
MSDYEAHLDYQADMLARAKLLWGIVDDPSNPTVEELNSCRIIPFV